MNKRSVVITLIATLAVVLLVGCTQSQPTGYANYQGGQQAGQAAIGGGCGVAAPAQDTNVASQIAGNRADSA